MKHNLPADLTGLRQIISTAIEIVERLTGDNDDQQIQEALSRLRAVQDRVIQLEEGGDSSPSKVVRISRWIKKIDYNQSYRRRGCRGY